MAREIIGANDDANGLRLDKFLSQACGSLLANVSRSRLQRWIDAGAVLVNGKGVTGRHKVAKTDIIEIRPIAEPLSEAMPEQGELQVLFEDPHVMVIHKPAGLVVHPAPGHATGTLVNRIRFHHEFDAGMDKMRPGIVHRLDKDTSGVMVIAKTIQAREALVPQFQAHSIHRIYDALVLGHMKGAKIYDTFHTRHPTQRQKFTTRTHKPDAKRAITHVKPLKVLHASTWIECRLETGRTHQIRVHLSEHGHPILGDTAYGRSVRDLKLRHAVEVIGHQALHARELGFEHPTSHKMMHFTAEPPSEFLAAAAALALTSI